jgi:protein-L-isoaspartate(D-aspartate) O-methyltransferase
MVASLRQNGIDGRVADAFEAVDRADFVPAELRDHAYEDRPLPIGGGQTISQPYIVAVMIEALALASSDRVLEIGTGSGYASALLAELAAGVWTVERRADLAERSERRLSEHRRRHPNCAPIHARAGDGSLGWPEQAPFEAILVSASGPYVPAVLVHQLAVGGRLVMPVGSDVDHQELVRVRRDDAGRALREHLGWVRFVPLVGEAAWEERHS